jgi:hypothetical protein
MSFTSIVERAREDPNFLHQLVFAPEGIVDELALDHRQRSRLAKLDPYTLVGLLGRDRFACGGSVTCSCTSATCDGTCGGSTCGLTCGGDSCGRTCDDSCGSTAGLSARRGEERA